MLSRKIYRDILIDSLNYCRKEKGLCIWAYVIMTNHMHCILSAKNGNLSDIIRDFKRFTATKIISSINKTPESRRDWIMKRFEFSARRNVRSSENQFWLYDSHAVELESLKFINQKMNYIHSNPVRAGWVDKPEDWMYSSARNYCNLPALIDIDLMDIPYSI